MTTAAFARRYQTMRAAISRRLKSLEHTWDSRALTRGCNHVLRTDGKRIRPVLLILSCEATGGQMRSSLDAGVALEMMHNFTLVHDDIMDNAPSRRGRPTVHTLLGTETGLLVGDVLLGLAYASLRKTRKGNMRDILREFTSGLLDVCEGQALDLEFERRADVRVAEYFNMIEKKTARMMSTATTLGAFIAGASTGDAGRLRRFGKHLGRAFQLQDDLLDVMADQKKIGKRIGGDIISGKKTFLLLTAAERATGKDRRFLRSIMHQSKPPDNHRQQQHRILTVRSLYEKYGIIDAAQNLIAKETRLAVRALSGLPQNRATEMLRWFSGTLLHRSF